jgi:site-specific recombinase XerC
VGFCCMRIPDHTHLDPATSLSRNLASVLIRGEGNKARRCPLWAQTVHELAELVQGRPGPPPTR